jgi:hypothetical protein
MSSERMRLFIMHLSKTFFNSTCRPRERFVKGEIWIWNQLQCQLLGRGHTEFRNVRKRGSEMSLRRNVVWHGHFIFRNHIFWIFVLKCNVTLVFFWNQFLISKRHITNCIPRRIRSAKNRISKLMRVITPHPIKSLPWIHLLEKARSFLFVC